MYDLARPAATRAHRTGFVLPSQDEWIKAAYYDPSGGGTYSYWKYPTNAGVFGDGDATAPAPTVLDPGHRRRHQRARRSRSPRTTPPASPAPTWCPGQVRPEACATVNPFGLDPATYAPALPGQPQHRRPGADHLAVGHPRPGRQRGRVDGHDRAAAGRAERRAGLAAAARRDLQRARLPDVALGGRPPAAGQRLLRPHLPLARPARRRHRRPAPGRVLAAGPAFTPGPGAGRAGTPAAGPACCRGPDGVCEPGPPVSRRIASASGTASAPGRPLRPGPGWARPRWPNAPWTRQMWLASVAGASVRRRCLVDMN